MKTVLHTRSDVARYWVGDGFPVPSLLIYQDQGQVELASPLS